MFKEMNLTDQLDMRDPKFVTEYATEIFNNLRKEEEGT